jgi:hypothetical protein
LAGNQPSFRKNIWVLAPAFGMVLFVILYFISTLLYPGGSQVDNHSIGFSWINNYWCNLLSQNAINGEPNPGRPIAIGAMLLLCLALANFWFIFPQMAGFQKSGRLIIQISGIFSMMITGFLFTDFHDVIIDIASLFGLVAILGTFIGLRKLKWNNLFRMGIFSLGLITLNNILYYGAGLKLYLPLVQKISFLYFLLWFFLIILKMYKKYSYQ